MRIVITDCDHDAFEEERAVAAEAGAELELHQFRDTAAILAGAQQADGILVQYCSITAEVMDGLPRLRAIGRYGVGYDSVDVPAATARGIAVCNVPDYGTEAVSDHTIALALTISRRIIAMDRQVRAGLVSLDTIRPVHQVAGRVFGVLGLGRIGRATARKAAGLGYRVIGYDPLLPAGATVYRGVETAGFDEVVRNSDVVSLHTPLDAETRHLIGAGQLAAMKPGAVLINCARGGVVDTAALVDALATGRLGGAGLDTHEIEPLPADHPLTGFDNVVLSPHFAWYTEESYSELKRRTIANVVDVCAGRRPRDIVNPEVLQQKERAL